MLPAYLLRAGIDFVRHNEEFKDSNPYSRCEASIKLCQRLWEEQIGKTDTYLLEPATVTTYWSEFFHAEDPTPDEREWREGLTKRSSQYDSFDEWQEWFKQTYAKVYKDDNIWLGVLMTAWAHTHQYDVIYSDDAWEFRLSSSYLPTSEMWRLEPHMSTVADLICEFWQEEVRAYEEFGFTISEQAVPFLGRVEYLGFDTRRYTASWPPRAQREREAIDVDEMVAEIVAPAGDDWYRHLDNVIFTDMVVDVTALANRARYIFGSKRRLMELTVDNGYEKALIQSAAEGWLVPELPAVGV